MASHFDARGAQMASHFDARGAQMASRALGRGARGARGAVSLMRKLAHLGHAVSKAGRSKANYHLTYRRD